MASTTVQIEVEDWVRKEWFPQKFGQKFRRERLRLESGGVFDFDAVSEDERVVATVSTSEAYTAGKKLAVGKLMKIRSDMLFLLMTPCDRRLVVLTAQSMFDQMKKERDGGRVPSKIEFFYAEIPPGLKARLFAAQQVASAEVSPSRG